MKGLTITSVLLGLILSSFGAHYRSSSSYSARDVLLNANETDTTRIYGNDLLGWGVDLRLARPEEALKVPLFNFDYSSQNEDNTYPYPLIPQTIFWVPDDVFVRTIAEQFATARIYETVDLYIENLKLDLGLSIEASKDTNNTAPDGELSLSMFSGDINVVYNSRALNQNTHLVTYNSLEYALWQLVIGPELGYRPKVEISINNLNVSSDDDVYNFLERHGTHFIESVIVGGKLELSTIVDKKFDNTSDAIAASATIAFKKAFGLDSFTATGSVEYEEIVTRWETETQMTLKAYGGDPDVSSFFGGSVNVSETFVAWQKSVLTNPAVIRYRLREISWLFPTANIRAQMRTAVKKYLSGALTLSFA